jgi:nucleoside phosphorylase
MTIASAIDELSPSAVIMVGIAFGVDRNKQTIGDVLISTHIWPYEPQRIGTAPDGGQNRIPRGSRVPASSRLLSLFRHMELGWQKSGVHFGLMISGEKLIDNIDFLDGLRSREPEAIGGEMEGAGLYSAASRRKVDWILAKAICDWADGKKRENKEKNQLLAAHNAAEFALDAVAEGSSAILQGDATLQGSGNVREQASRERVAAVNFPMPSMRREFSQRERDQFLEASFRTIRSYFEQALNELETRFDEVETSITDVTALKFICRLYRRGEQVNQCKIWIGGFANTDSICYSEGRFNIDRDNSMNDWLSVTQTEDSLCLEASGMQWGSNPASQAALSPEEAAEYLWRRFIYSLNG